jgi:peptidyl-prolyl cis-trans isomerase SurA
MFLKRFLTGLVVFACAVPVAVMAQLRLSPGAPTPQTQPAPIAPSTPPTAAAQAKPRPIVLVDRVAAVVNDDVITRNELTDRVNRALSQLSRSGTPPPPRDELQRQMLDRMISDRVMTQFARDFGIRVDDLELDRAIERIARDNQMIVAQLRMAMEKDGVPFDKFRRDIRDEIIIARVREREVNDRISVTESEVDSLLASPGEGAATDEFNLSHILVRVPDNAGPEQIQSRQARALQALGQLKSGTDFRQVAASFSDAPDALQGGSLGWREGGKLPVIFTDALRGMKPGDLSGVLRSANGFHILKLNEQRGSQQAVVVQQTRARHILIKVSEVLSERDGQTRLAQLRERLVNKADFAQLARANSEDTSASRGGELGWISPGDTVPEFERAMDALKPGEISPPVRSPFGWHLIQVLERRSADMTSEKKRMAARMALRERKSEEQFQEWLRQARSRSYIEIKLDER